MARMMEAEKMQMVKAILGITDDSENECIAIYLRVAEKEIIAWRYSYGSSEVTLVPEEYEMTQVYAVIAGYSQSGAENQQQHTENGIARVFRFSDMIQYIRANVIPLCKVL